MLTDDLLCGCFANVNSDANSRHLLIVTVGSAFRREHPVLDWRSAQANAE